MISAPYPLPERQRNTDGALRKVGFELEFSGIPINEARRQLLAFGCSEEKGSPVEAVFRHSLGEFTLELDWAYIKKLGNEQDDGGESARWFDLLTQAASLVVPVEIVCPPIALDQLHQLDNLTEALRGAGATGTEESPIAAYGVHINTEAPATDATTLCHYLLAFCLMQWWLVDAHRVDLTRRISPYVDLFPESFLQQLIDSAPPADIGCLIDLYLEYNPTRNRALDMLPLFSWVDEDRVKNQLDEPLIKKRPAFHYRLPNCHIGRPGWSLRNEWQCWLAVEKLAARPDELAELATEFRRNRQFLLGVNRRQWTQRIEQWLQDHSSV